LGEQEQKVVPLTQDVINEWRNAYKAVRPSGN
jgi:hypothetical protein